MKSYRWASFALFLSLIACGEPDAPKKCKAGQALCGDACVALDSDPANCGGCGRTCDAGEVCSVGSCVVVCDEGRAPCRGACVDLDDDPANCGACGNACEDGLVCQGGACKTTCEGATTACEGSCVDTSTDPLHCGGCGNACGESEVCGAGACECPAGAQRCGEACAFLDEDPSHCGGCDVRCEAGPHAADATCGGGRCLQSCVDGFADCDGEPDNGCEADLGAPESCGACGIACREDQACGAEGCGCPEGFLECDGVCRDLANDPDHCGGCDVSCADRPNSDGATCSEGACVFACVSPYGDCDGDGENGCETWTRTSQEHCGGCGIACRADEVCAASTCTCPEGLTECGGTCVDLMTDADHCGGCGEPCDGVCAQGVCCAQGLVACGSACADLGTDPDHCGGCGVSCADFPNAASGVCEDSACVAITCREGFDDCNGQLADGCEVDLLSDKDNCGACGAPSCEIGCGAGACATVVAISARNDHGCVILSGDGSVKCWGSNRDGQLGDGKSGSGVRSLVPAYVLDPKDPVGRLTGAQQVVTGFGHTCVRTAAQTAKCWGQALDPLGQIVIATEPFEVEDPSDPSGLLSGVVELAAGKNFNCALLQGGTVKCWGAVPSGDNSTPSTTVPLPTEVLVSNFPVVALTGVTHVAAGTTHACAVMDDTSVKCWGKNASGELGDGTTNGSFFPVTVGGSTPLLGATRLALAQDHSCALMEGGTVQCWGKNGKLQLGAAGPDSPHPLQVPGLQGVEQITAGMVDHTCARLTDGTARCWGNGANNRLGDGGTANSGPTPVKDGSGTQDLGGITHVEGGNVHGCATVQSGEIFCWGRNNNGQLGNGSTTTAPLATRVVW